MVNVETAIANLIEAEYGGKCYTPSTWGRREIDDQSSTDFPLFFLQQEKAPIANNGAGGISLVGTTQTTLAYNITAIYEDATIAVRPLLDAEAYRFHGLVDNNKQLNSADSPTGCVLRWDVTTDWDEVMFDPNDDEKKRNSGFTIGVTVIYRRNVQN